MRILIWIIGGIAFGYAFGLLLGRYAVPVGIVFMLIGMGPMTALYFYTDIAQPARDMSAEGMLSTLAFLIFAPFGFCVFIAGLLQR